MSPNTNIFTQIATELGQELAEKRRQANKAKPIPFGMQQATPDMEAKLLKGMSPEGYKTYLEKNGPLKTIDLLRRMKKSST